MYSVFMSQEKKHEKAPITIDTRLQVDNTDVRPAVEMIISAEEAEKLQGVAEKIGGYTVKITAEAGDPYKVIYNLSEFEGGREEEFGYMSDQPPLTSEVMPVPAGRVAVRIEDIQAQQKGKYPNLSPLYRAAEQTEADAG